MRPLWRIFGGVAGSAGRGNGSARAGGFAARAMVGSGFAARVDRREARSASRDPRPRRPNLWMQLGHDKVAVADFWR
jgi:hypothetical protein